MLTVLVQAQSAAGVLDEQVEQANLVVANLRDRRHDVVGDEVRAARLGGQGKVLLRPRHDAGARGVSAGAGKGEKGQRQRPEGVKQAWEEAESK